MSLSPINTPCFYLDAGLTLLATGVYTVTRPVAPTYPSGVETPDPSPTTFQIQAVVNPLHGVDLMRLAEGRRANDFREIYTSVALNTNSDADSADLVTIGADTFEVNESQPWQNMGNVWRCILERTNRLNAAGATG